MTFLLPYSVSGIDWLTAWCVNNKFGSPTTESLKKACPRLRDPASWLPLAAGASSLNLQRTSLFEGLFTACEEQMARQIGSDRALISPDKLLCTCPKHI